jgi:transcriptional regulator with XRE-family HTH domain
MKTVNYRLAMQLKKYRNARGLTQVALANKVGLSLGYIARLEIGRHDPPLSTLAKLAKALRCKVSALVD